MKPGRSLAAFAAVAAIAAVLSGGRALDAQPAKAEYLPYAAFSPADTPEQIALKHGYNGAVQRYNQSVYDYLVTLERHNQLVELHNKSGDPAERKRARAEAQPLRAKLEDLRRTVTARAAAVDQGRRRAAAAGVSLAP